MSFSDGYFELNGSYILSLTYDTSHGILTLTKDNKRMIGYISGIDTSKRYNFAVSIKGENEEIIVQKYYTQKKRELVISERTQYIMNGTHYWTAIHIKEYGRLTVSEWNIDRKYGGVLLIFCENIILENGAGITLNGKGYKGGKRGHSGHSYKGTSKKTTKANFGGGGYSDCGGGGGYGSKGKDGLKYVDRGGNIYGNEQLSILHLGSGGGGDTFDNGGSGGGALKIHCLGDLILKEDAFISCNGGKSGLDGGCGSGGSIHIIVNGKENIKMSELSSITAQGGGNVYCSGGNGGIGRIRIEFMSNKDTEYNTDWNISPDPFVG
eukprot:439274_1